MPKIWVGRTKLNGEKNGEWPYLKKSKRLSTERTSSTKFELLVPPINGKMSCDLFWRVARCLGKDEKTLNAMQMIIIVFQPHNPAPSAMQVDPSFKVFMRKIYCSSSYHSKIHLPEYQVFYSLWHFSECNVNLLKDNFKEDEVVLLNLRTVPTIVIAHTFCASRDTRISYR